MKTHPDYYPPSGSVSLLLLSLALLVASCQWNKGKTATGDMWENITWGMDATRFKVKPGGIDVTDMNQSKSLIAVLDAIKEMWQNYLIAEGLKFALGKYYDHQGALVNADKTLKLEELRNAKSLQQANSALDVLQATPVQ